MSDLRKNKFFMVLMDVLCVLVGEFHLSVTLLHMYTSDHCCEFIKVHLAHNLSLFYTYL